MKVVVTVVTIGRPSIEGASLMIVQLQTSRTIVSSCTSVSVDTEDTVRSVLTVLELVLDPWRPELELLAGVTLVLELDIVTLTISSISISTQSLYLYIYNSISK